MQKAVKRVAAKAPAGRVPVAAKEPRKVFFSLCMTLVLVKNVPVKQDLPAGRVPVEGGKARKYRPNPDLPAAKAPVGNSLTDVKQKGAILSGWPLFIHG
jgi:hypothetical protein